MVEEIARDRFVCPNCGELTSVEILEGNESRIYYLVHEEDPRKPCGMITGMWHQSKLSQKQWEEREGGP